MNIQWKLPVNPFIIIPRDQLDKVVIQSNSSLGIKNTRPAKGQVIIQFTCKIRKVLKTRKKRDIARFAPPAVSHKVTWYHIILSITKDFLQISLIFRPERESDG